MNIILGLNPFRPQLRGDDRDTGGHGFENFEACAAARANRNDSRHAGGIKRANILDRSGYMDAIRSKSANFRRWIAPYNRKLQLWMFFRDLRPRRLREPDNRVDVCVIVHRADKQESRLPNFVSGRAARIG